MPYHIQDIRINFNIFAHIRNVIVTKNRATIHETKEESERVQTRIYWNMNWLCLFFLLIYSLFFSSIEYLLHKREILSRAYTNNNHISTSQQQYTFGFNWIFAIQWKNEKLQSEHWTICCANTKTAMQNEKKKKNNSILPFCC